MDELIAAAVIFPILFGTIYLLSLAAERREKRSGAWHPFEGDKMRRWVRGHWNIRPMTAKELSEADEYRDSMSM